MYRLLQEVVEFLSGEWMLTKLGKANGGTIILLRSLCTALIVFSFALILMNVLDPQRGWEFSSPELQSQVVSKFTWFGAIFAATYIALYSRFASQWIYLSNLYNSIKQTQTSKDHCEETMAEWKAGFMEDAEYLHMAKKNSIAPIINVWGNDQKVKKKFIEHTPGGNFRYEKLMKDVGETIKHIESEYTPNNA